MRVKDLVAFTLIIMGLCGMLVAPDMMPGWITILAVTFIWRMD